MVTDGCYNRGMKQIKVSDEVYQRIKGHADGGYRSLGSQIEMLLDHYEGIKVSAPRTLGEHIKEDSVVTPYVSTVSSSSLGERSKQGIVKEINLLQAQVDQADPVNQDPDYWETINEKKIKIQSLWDEWHRLEEK